LAGRVPAQLFSQANQLGYFASYFMATGDPTGIFRRHLPAIMHYIKEYRTLRAQALALPNTSAAFGMIAGNTIDDLWGTAVECGTTYPDGKGGPNGDCNVALPAFDIQFKVVAAFRVVADVFDSMAAVPSPTSGTPDIGDFCPGAVFLLTPTRGAVLQQYTT